MVANASGISNHGGLVSDHCLSGIEALEDSVKMLYSAVCKCLWMEHFAVGMVYSRHQYLAQAVFWLDDRFHWRL